MAKRRNDLKSSWPYLALAAVVAVVVVLAVISQGTGVSGAVYGDVAASADKAAGYRAKQKEAESDAYTHKKMADFHAQQAASASTVGGTISESAKEMGEKVQEGTASVREDVNGAMADYHNGQMEEAISATLPVSRTAQ